MKPFLIIMRTLALLAVLCMVAVQLSAQQFILLAVNGDVQTNTSGQWRKATSGTRLAPTDQLKLGDHSYAAVVYNNSRTYELKRVGLYPMQQLITSANTPASSVTSKYVEYVVNRNSSNKLGNNMSNLGAVERSMAPSPLSPRDAQIADDNVTFRWRAQPNAKSYAFEFRDLDGNSVFKQTVEDTFVTVNLAPYNLKPEDCYFWRIANSHMMGMPSDEICFRMLPADKRAEITKSVADMKASMGGDENSAVYNIMLASYYQDQQVNDKAMEAYEKAIALEPDVQDYRKMYGDFLQKINLNTYAAEVMGQR